MAFNIVAINSVLKNKRERVTSEFGNRTFLMNGKTVSNFHNGIDLIDSVSHTDYIVAIQSGKVIESSNKVTVTTEAAGMSRGNYIYIDHGNGFVTRYYHLKYNSLYVKVGQIVNKGDTIAFMGSTGFSTGNHLHLGIYYNGVAQDPLPYLKGEKNIPQYYKDTLTIQTFIPYKVKITTRALNVRSSPVINPYNIVSIVKLNEIYTIIEENGTWGKLSNGKGWISISPAYVARI